MFTKRGSKILSNSSAVLGLGSILLYLFVSYFFSAEYTQNFSSDHLYIALLFKDIFENGGSFLDWTTPPANYFFPDMFLFAFAFLFSSEIYFQLFIHLCIQFLTFGFFIWRILKLLNIECSHLLAVMCLLLFSLMETTLFFQAGHHFGALWAAVFCFYLMLSFVDRSADRPVYSKYLVGFTLFISIFLSTVSDKFFLLWFTIPVLMCLAILTTLQIVRWNKDYSAVTSAFIVASVCGYLVYEYILPLNTSSFSLKLTQSLTSTTEQFFILLSKVVGNVLGDWYLVICFGIGLFFTFYSLGRVVLKIFTRNDTCLSVLGVVWICSFAPLLFSLDEYVLRYFIPTILIPYVSFVIWLAGNNTKARNTIVSLTTITFSIFVLWNLNVIYSKNGSRFSYYPSNVACVDEIVSKFGLKNGVSTYWNASPIEAFSKKDVEMAHIDTYLNETHWISSKNKFRDSYGFAFVPVHFEKTLTKKLTRSNESNSTSYNCPSGRVIIFENPKLKLPHFSVVDAYSWLACDLDSNNTSVDPLTCARRKRPSLENGIMTSGPYVKLPPGRYVGSIKYSYQMPKNDCDATWDVVAHYKTYGTQIIESGTLCDNEDIIKEQLLSFEILETGPVEIRTMVGKNDDLTLSSISLSKADTN